MCLRRRLRFRFEHGGSGSPGSALFVLMEVAVLVEQVAAAAVVGSVVDVDVGFVAAAAY